MIEPEEKLCSKCNEKKSIFARHYGRGGATYRSECIDCHNAYRRAYNKSHPRRVAEWNKQKARKGNDKHRNRQFKNSHAHDAYLRLLEAQGGVCAICGKTETSKDQFGKVRSLALDHNHQTGHVRGLLCFRCNVDLASLEDETFVNAAKTYLARYAK